MATDPNNDAGQQRDERTDDEELIENLDRLQLVNAKESFDIHRGDDRHGFRTEDNDGRTVARTLFQEYTQAIRRENARADRLEQLFLAQLSNQQQNTNLQQINATQVTNRDQLQSTAHRDLAVAQEWRDQARDSGESVFKPQQSS